MSGAHGSLAGHRLAPERERVNPCRRPVKHSGFALVVVLWATALLSVIATSFALNMREETRLAENLVARARAEAVADAGIRRGILALLAEVPGPRRESDGLLYELPFAGGSMRIRMVSENGKIDLNGAPQGLIHGLLETLVGNGAIADAGQAARVADAILDWRDSDHWVRTRGAEDQTYTAKNAPLGARDGPFLSVAELNLVHGVGGDVYAQLAPWVTVYSGSAQVDPITAPRTVLQAIPGLDAGHVDDFIAARNAWRAGQSALPGGSPRLSLEMLSSGARYLSQADAGVYTVDAVSVLPDGTRASRRAVIRLTGEKRRPYTIIVWFDAIPDAETDALARSP
jgi:general secretion pathway protein K